MFNIKKCALTLVERPEIVTLLAVYMLIAASAMPLFFSRVSPYLFLITWFVLLLLTSAFCAGWFGVIKSAVLKKKTQTDSVSGECDNETTGFFESVPVYMPAVFLYILFTTFVIWGLVMLADHLFRGLNDMFLQMNTMNKDALANYFATLPMDVKMSILKRSAFLYAGIFGHMFLTLYSIPSIYFSKRKNVFIGIKKGLFALIKRPLYSLLLFGTILFFHILLIFIEALSIMYPYTIFIALVLRLYFIAFVVVVVFSVYEENFCNNGPDSIGENGCSN